MTEIHELLSVSVLQDRYGVARSQVYNRLKVLQIEAEKRGNKAYVNARQIALLDQIHQMVSINGMNLEDAAAQLVGGIEHTEQPTLIPQNRATLQADDPQQGFMQALIRSIWAIAQRQADPVADPLHRYRQLEEIAHKDWLLSTSDLVAILGVKPRAEMEREGYRFLRAGKNGSETALESGEALKVAKSAALLGV